MAGLVWIVLFLCAAGCHQSSPSYIPRSALVVHRGQNVSLACNITPSSVITWYLLRSDQLLPLLRVLQSQLRGKNDIIDYNNVNTSRITWTGNLKSGLVRLEIQEVEEEDAGLYFCSGLCEAKVCVSRGIHLKFNGVDVDTAGRKPHQPCWSLGTCLLPGSLGLFSFLVIGFYLCLGKPGHCCCNPGRQDSALRVTEVSRYMPHPDDFIQRKAEEDSLHYSSLRHPDKPRSSDRTEPRSVEDFVTYSTVTTRKNLNGLHDQR